MSGFYVGQKVKVTKDHTGEYGDEIKYKVGDILVVSSVDRYGDPSLWENGCLQVGILMTGLPPITDTEPEIEVTQIRYLGRLYNLVEE